MRAASSSRGRAVNAGIVAMGLLLATCAQNEHLASAPAPGASPAPPTQPTPAPLPDLAGEAPAHASYDEVGVASWYGGPHQGRRTASGARFDKRQLTAAHRSLPLGTSVLVENLANGRQIALRITDRGPYVAGRIIDLSQEAAHRLGLEHQGVGLVGITILPPPLQLAAAP
jgi:rare lipoprotein A (peptidoglycan hydrolase)